MPLKPVFFESAAAFRAWLEAHGERERELLVGFHKVATGRPSLTWPQSVDEALCFGWIDGVRKRIDDGAYTIRFTPRRPGSIWSAVNVARVAALAGEGRMRPAGLAAFERRIERRTGVYAYEQRDAAALSPSQARRFRQARAAWRWFEAAAPSYRQRMLYWVVSAKKPETRERRLAQLIAACAEGREILR